MAYIDAKYYKNDYKGKVYNLDEPEIESNIERASDMIDTITGFKLQSGEVDLESSHPLIKSNVKKATAAMTEYYLLNGGYDSLINAGMSSVNIGGFSYQVSQSNGTTIEVPENVMSMLSVTGLLYAGTDAIDGRFYYEC